MTSAKEKFGHLGVGLGLRRAHFGTLLAEIPPEIEWFEIAPENYMEIGGKLYRDFCLLAEKLPIRTHSVSLSLGSLDPVDYDYLTKLKSFLDTHKIPTHSDHICFSSYKGIQFDDLIPLPYTEEAIKHTAKKIRQVQDILERPLAVENISSYASAGYNEMDEANFVSAIIEEADCGLLLDINNVYVNSINHQIDAEDFLKKIPHEKITYIHIAGHYQKKPDFILDTHGDQIISPVWELLTKLGAYTSVPNILIERDNNIPPLEQLSSELRFAKSKQEQFLETSHVAS